MNERIKELAGQAGLGYMFNRNENKSPGMCRPEDLEKFAELIVRECAKIVNDNDFEGSVVGDGMLFEHFGVKK